MYGGMYRKFQSPFGTLEINKPLPDGRVINDITSIPRAKVIVTESPEGLSKRTNDRAIAMQGLQYLSDQPFARALFTQKLLNAMDNVSATEKEAIKKATDMDMEYIMNQLAANNYQAELSVLQMEQARQQMLNPQAAPPQQGAPEEMVQQEQI